MPKGVYVRTAAPWNKGTKGLQVSWSKGLTARTDARVAKFGAASGKSRRGKPAWNKGKRGIYSPEAIRKIKESRARQGCSVETRRKISMALGGDKSHWWRGGVTTLKRLIRRSFQYRQWRSDVFTRDNFTCRACGTRGVFLHAHHQKSFSEILTAYGISTLEMAIQCEELWNINNGETLCKSCHNLLHGLTAKTGSEAATKMGQATGGEAR